MREGWDNPNIFQICTLKHSQSTTSKRQEIGRGLRIAVDKDGNAMLDKYGVQIITRGLKYNAIQIVKEQQAGYLSQTDWYIIRKADAGTAIPTAIQTFRNAIRADATRIENAITAATTMDEFIALHTTTYNKDRTVDIIAITQSWTEE